MLFNIIYIGARTATDCYDVLRDFLDKNDSPPYLNLVKHCCKSQLLDIIGEYSDKGLNDSFIDCLHKIFAKHFKALLHDEFKRNIAFFVLMLRA